MARQHGMKNHIAIYPTIVERIGQLLKNDGKKMSVNTLKKVKAF